MKKEKKYRYVRFPAEIIKKAYEKYMELLRTNYPDFEKYNQQSLEVEHEDCVWKYDSPEEFFADYRRYYNDATFLQSINSIELNARIYPNYTIISISGQDRNTIESLFEIFENNLDKYRIPEPPKPPLQKPTIFIGHGQSFQWRDLKDHLQDKHGFKIEAYETGARAGHTIRDILEEMVKKSSFALLVMTGEDQIQDGIIRARQNVIHETGLFQGRLGFSRAIVLLEEGVEEFSNIFGVQQIRFSKNNIKETFGEILATIKREFSVD